MALISFFTLKGGVVEKINQNQDFRHPLFGDSYALFNSADTGNQEEVLGTLISLDILLYSKHNSPQPSLCLPNPCPLGFGSSFWNLHYIKGINDQQCSDQRPSEHLTQGTGDAEPIQARHFSPSCPLCFPPSSKPYPASLYSPAPPNPCLPLLSTFANEGQGGWFFHWLRGKLLELREAGLSLGIFRFPYDGRIFLDSIRVEVQDGSQMPFSLWVHFWSLPLGRAVKSF